MYQKPEPFEQINSMMHCAGDAPEAIIPAKSKPDAWALIPKPPKIVKLANVPSKPAVPPCNNTCLIVRPFEIFAMKNGVATHQAIQYAQ